MTGPTLRVVTTEDESTGLGRPLPVKLSRVERFEGQPRRWFNPVTIEELADDIQINGQNTPVSVCKHSSKTGVFVLIGGERRLRAFQIIAKRTGADPLIDCFIDTVHDERHHFRKAFRDNLQREDLIPVDVAASYQRLYNESRAESHHAKIVDVAHEAKKSTTHVENYLYLNRLSGEVKKLMDPERKKEEQLGTTTAIEIARSTDSATLQLELAKEAIERGLGLVEARTLIRVKTGKSGYGIGGRMRVPADDYKAFKVFLAGIRSRAERIDRAWDLDSLYKTRPDEFGDRERDSVVIKDLISRFQSLLKQVEEK